MSRRSGGATAGGGRPGYTLLEVIIALGLGTLVVALVGALFLFSFRAWQRGNDLREVQVQATLAADLIARDIRAGSRAGVVLQPDGVVENQSALLAIAAPPEPGGTGPLWIFYVLDPAQELRRLLVRTDGERPVVQQSRVVARGVARVEVQPADGSVTVDVEVRRGGATFRVRRTAAPQNP